MDFETRTNARLRKIKERIEILEQLKKIDQTEKNILESLADAVKKTTNSN